MNFDDPSLPGSSMSINLAYARESVGSHGSSGDESMEASGPVARATFMLSRRRSSKAAVPFRAAPHLPFEPRKAPSTPHFAADAIPRGPSLAAGRARKGYGKVQDGESIGLAVPHLPTLMSYVRPVRTSDRGYFIRRPGRSDGRTCARRATGAARSDGRLG